MADPYHAKQILGVLQNVIKKYEDDFGKITKPKAYEIAEKKQKKIVAKKTSEHDTDAPTYFG